VSGTGQGFATDNGGPGWKNHPYKANDGRPEILIYGKDQILTDSYSAIPVDRSGRYVPIIEPEHTRIHEGVAYIHSHEHIALNNENVDHLLVNPAGNFPHLRWWRFITTASPGMVAIFRSPTTTDNGSAVNIINLNDNSTNTPNLGLFSNPIVTDVGTEMYVDYITGTKLQGGSPDKIISEIILKPSTNYLIRYTNRAGVDIDLNTNIFWYEPS
jgi:hypothetical protein